MVSFPIHIADDCPFQLQNIPFGIFSTSLDLGRGAQQRAGTAIGSYIIDLDILVKHGLFDEAILTKPLGDVFLSSNLNEFAALPASDRSAVRESIIRHLTSESSAIFQDQRLNKHAFIHIEQAQMHLPMAIGDYADFLCSYTHAKNGFGESNIPKPFWEHPMAYNGRKSSIAVSGTKLVRPQGYFPSTEDALHVSFLPTRELDFETELGVFISAPIKPGTRVNAQEAVNHIFGFVLLNDWSARDIQRYEWAPLGCLHSKGFLTSMSPWIVTLDALKSSRCSPPGASESSHLNPNLVCLDENHGLFDIDLSAKVSRNGANDVKMVQSHSRDNHWSPCQMIAYQSSSGHGLNTGDLLGTGTVSSPAAESSTPSEKTTYSTFGCLAESIMLGDTLPNVGDKQMSWLEDGDEVTLEGWFKTTDGRSAGFGPLSGVVWPADTSNGH